MTPDQIACITNSFHHLLLIEDTLAALFYGHLFELEPSLRPMFQADMRGQGRKFMTMLHLIVSGLHDLDQLLPSLQELGRRHRDYGVREVHYETVRAALRWALRQGLGERFTPDVEQAWNALYLLVADRMKAAASQATG